MPSTYMHKRTFTMLLFILIFFLSPGQLFAVDITSGDSQIESRVVTSSAGISAALDVLSTDPSTGNLTTIQASGVWRNGCVPVLDSIEITDMGLGTGALLIKATAEQADQPCGQVETEWSFSVDVEFELPGYYMAELLIVSEQLEATALNTSTEIMVNGHLGFTPETPQLEEPFTITVTGLHGDGCIPEYVSHETINDKIIVELMTPDSAQIICGQVLTPWEVDVEIAALDSGEHAVEIYKSAQYDGVAIERSLYKTETVSIGVRASQVLNYTIYLPSISSE